MKIHFNIKVENGKLVWTPRLAEHFRVSLSKMKNGWKEFTLSDIFRRRTLPANSFYRLRLHILAMALEGMDDDTLHLIIMKRLFFNTANVKFGKIYVVGGMQEFIRDTSTELSVEEFSLMILEQQVIADFHNEGREESNKIILPTKEEI